MKVTEHLSYGYVEKYLTKNKFDIIDKHANADFYLFNHSGLAWSLYTRESVGETLFFSKHNRFEIPVPDTEEKFLELMKILEPSLA